MKGIALSVITNSIHCPVGSASWSTLQF